MYMSLEPRCWKFLTSLRSRTSLVVASCFVNFQPKVSPKFGFIVAWVFAWVFALKSLGFWIFECPIVRSQSSRGDRRFFLQRLYFLHGRVYNTLGNAIHPAGRSQPYMLTDKGTLLVNGWEVELRCFIQCINSSSFGETHKKNLRRYFHFVCMSDLRFSYVAQPGSNSVKKVCTQRNGTEDHLEIARWTHRQARHNEESVKAKPNGIKPDILLLNGKLESHND